MANNPPYPGTLIGDVLVNLGYAKREDVEKAASEQKPGGKRIGDIMVDEGTATRKQVEDAFNVQKELRAEVEKALAAGEHPDPAEIVKMTKDIAEKLHVPIVEKTAADHAQIDFNQKIMEQGGKPKIEAKAWGDDHMFKASFATVDKKQNPPIDLKHA